MNEPKGSKALMAGLACIFALVGGLLVPHWPLIGGVIGILSGVCVGIIAPEELRQAAHV